MEADKSVDEVPKKKRGRKPLPEDVRLENKRQSWRAYKERNKSRIRYEKLVKQFKELHPDEPLPSKEELENLPPQKCGRKPLPEDVRLKNYKASIQKFKERNPNYNREGPAYERQQEPMLCEACNCHIIRKNISIHLKTQKHQTNANKNLSDI